jgi:hypothetical protein
MTACVCLAVPDMKCDVSAHFSKLITFESIGHTKFGRAILGSSSRGRVFLLSISGRTEGLVGRGARRDRLAHLFIQGVTALLPNVTKVSFVVAWQNERLWDDPSIVTRSETISLSDFQIRFPENVEMDVRYVLYNEHAYYRR